MTTGDLKTGMILETVGGKLAMVLLNTANGDIISGEAWAPLPDKPVFLEEWKNDPYSRDHAIQSVYQPQSNMDYLGGNGKLTRNGVREIWRRSKPATKLTVREVCDKLGYDIEIIPENKQ